MKSYFSSMARRATGRRLDAALGAAAAAVVLLAAGCGGGGETNDFSADRVLAFGDESSVINADGSKYTVNAVTAATGAIDCQANPIWTQQVAALYALRFPQCNVGVGATADPPSRIRAAPGARVADLAAQIDAQVAAGPIHDGDLATVLVGANDIVALFANYPATAEARLLLDADAAGVALAGQVNRLAALGARVLVATIPDVGLMPFAGSRAAGSTNPAPAVLSRLSTRFNDAMLASLVNDGRRVGLVQLDNYLRTNDRLTAVNRGDFANTTAGSCSVALPGCTTLTQVPAAQTTAWLWADDRHFGAAAHIGLGELAVSRARNNPF